MLEKGISAEVRGAAKAMRSFKNKLGGVFDLPAEMTEQVEANWNDTATITLQKCETLPELAPLKFDNSVPRSGFGGGGRGRGGGGRGGGRGRGGGFSGQKDPLAAVVTDNLGKEKSTRLTDFRLS